MHGHSCWGSGRFTGFSLALISNFFKCLHLEAMRLFSTSCSTVDFWFKKHDPFECVPLFFFILPALEPPKFEQRQFILSQFNLE